VPAIVGGYEVTATASLAEALQAATEYRDIALVITDYHLTNGETAFEVITALRAILGISLKILVITGDTSSVMRELAEEAHLRILSKPMDADELMRLLEGLLAS
jgi:CheY-like chemotaxis protein